MPFFNGASTIVDEPSMDKLKADNDLANMNKKKGTSMDSDMDNTCGSTAILSGGSTEADHENLSQTEECSETSSDVDVDESSQTETGSATSTTTTIAVSASVPKTLTKPKSKAESDPYADVRDRIEALSLHSRMVHAHHTQEEDNNATHQSVPFFAAWTTYLSYAILIFVGHVRDFCAKLCGQGRYIVRSEDTGCPADDFTKYAPLLKSFEVLFTRRIYHRIQDAWNRPISSNPGAKVNILERISQDGNKTMEVLGTLDALSQEDANIYAKGEYFATVSGDRVTRRCLNLASYNYLGFADDWNVTCREGVMGSLQSLPVSMGSSRMECGTSKLHHDVEEIVAKFCGQDDAMAVNMGFNTNATTIPALMGRGDLIISDELNHTSIVNGARTSGSAIRCFRHNDTNHLEEILKEAIVLGQPRTRRPWGKIMVIVEGIYSMEGEFCDLRNIVKVCKEYGAYIYLDEAHSIGATGPSGKGILEYTGVDPKDVDIMMGTFTKSFGGMGGYIASSKDVINHLRRKCAASSYHNSLSPVVCQQVISSFKVIMGLDGTNIGKQKITALRDNSNYFRMRLCDMGLHVLGHYDSPICPIMLYNPAKISAFSRECYKRGLAVCVVGFPATPILMSRARFCISAGHTREDLDVALEKIEEVADLLMIRYAKNTFFG
mmetsp:Transcript_25099/g.37135  ORF Transcript_25099/g.37135 Transcript_25099/m.37135 type:complete len:664 (+) Transcript_25099:498-2489(+)